MLTSTLVKLTAIIALSFPMARGAKKNTAGSIRIIGGQWRGRKLSVLDAEGLRPTTDRTKETLFNWLMPYTQGARCLDAFAGTGSLGLEALSRYADSVTFIEQSKQAAKKLTEHLTLLKVDKQNAQVQQGDALQLIPSLSASFDLIFIDPPFAKGLARKAVDLVEQHQLLAPHGVVYLEVPAEESAMTVPDTWQLLKSKSTQQVSYSLYINDRH